MFQMRAQDFGIRVGSLPRGPRNKITDVPGVLVGHATVDTPTHKTGVTVILPGPQNPFTHKLPAGVCPFNGFGKTAGLLQLQELGTLETPIALTNTLNVGLVHDAMVEYMLSRCEAEGVVLRSVNPLVCECNDSTLNHIGERAVGREHVFSALASACQDFAEGDVGGGKGMICHGLKGGIGSASRVLAFDGKTYTIGILVQSNHGVLSDLTVSGVNIGAGLARTLETPGGGSGLHHRRAGHRPAPGRPAACPGGRRVSVGLARLGSHIGHGSGEVFVAFSTANPFDFRTETAVRMTTAFHEELLDLPFRAAAECTEEAVLNSMLTAHTVTGWQGNTVYALPELWRPGV